MTKLDSIINQNLYMNIATVCEDGSPWNTPVFFAGNLEDGLVWWSSVSSQHSQNIARDARVFITIYNSKEVEGKGVGVYLQGHAKEVQAEEMQDALNAYNAKAQSFKLTTENSSGNAPTRLYMFVPQKIWMNDGIEEDGFYQDIREVIK